MSNWQLLLYFIVFTFVFQSLFVNTVKFSKMIKIVTNHNPKVVENEVNRLVAAGAKYQNSFVQSGKTTVVLDVAKVPVEALEVKPTVKRTVKK